MCASSALTPGCMHRWGSIEQVEPGLPFEVNERNNRSYVEFVHTQADSRPAFAAGLQREGGRNGNC